MALRIQEKIENLVLFLVTNKVLRNRQTCIISYYDSDIIVLIAVSTYVKLNQQRGFWHVSLLTFLTLPMVIYSIVSKVYVSLLYFEL